SPKVRDVEHHNIKSFVIPTGFPTFGCLMTPTMRPLPPTDENELLLRLRSGDHSAFETLYCRYARRVAATLLKITRSREMAEDLLQDTFIKVWAVRNNIKPNHSFPAFVFTIAANLASNSVRKR